MQKPVPAGLEWLRREVVPLKTFCIKKVPNHDDASIYGNAIKTSRYLID